MEQGIILFWSAFGSLIIALIVWGVSVEVRFKSLEKVSQYQITQTRNMLEKLEEMTRSIVNIEKKVLELALINEFELKSLKLKKK